MTTKEEVIEKMIIIGRQMSNLCYNLKQEPQLAEREGNIKAMGEMVRAWDAAVSHYRTIQATIDEEQPYDMPIDAEPLADAVPALAKRCQRLEAVLRKVRELCRFNRDEAVVYRIDEALKEQP